MRKLLISILLASAVATPALADPPSKADREQAREERKKDRDERQQAREQSRQERGNTNAPQFNSPPRVQQPAQVQRQSFGGANRDARRDARDARRDSLDAARDMRADQRQDRVDQRQQLRQDRVDAREARQAARTPVVSNVPRPGTMPPARVDNRRGNTQRWSTNWRHDNRYDWNNYRHRHRSLFHLGFYFDPFGWGYQPYQIGWRMWPNYYSNRYWINDPWQYRLPYAPPGYQWVRYWNDAVLVDTWSGEVVDVLYNFFW